MMMENEILFKQINDECDEIPIVLIDNSRSTTHRMMDSNVLRKELEIAEKTFTEKGIERVFLMFWNNTYKSIGIVDVKNLSKFEINSEGQTHISNALSKIPNEWYNSKKVTDCYIFTDGETNDKPKSAASEFIKLINKKINFFITTVEPTNANYLNGNCNAGNTIYEVLRSNCLTKHIRKFVSYNCYHLDGFVSLSNPDVDCESKSGYVPFREHYFDENNVVDFLKYLENQIEDIYKKTDKTDTQLLNMVLLKLVHEISLSAYYLTKDKSLKIKKGVIDMFSKLFVDTSIYNEAKTLLAKETENHILGQATTFQSYKNNRNKLFETAQTNLYVDCKKAISNVDSDYYMSFPISLTDKRKMIIRTNNDEVNHPVYILDKKFLKAGLKIGKYVVPMLPVDVVMDDSKSDQCVRQWIRAIYGKKYRINTSSDALLYYFLTDVLSIYTSDVSAKIKSAYVNLARIMLNRKRFGKNVKEYDYLLSGSAPAPVIDDASGINKILTDCLKFANLDTSKVSEFTLWYGIVNMMGDSQLINSQYKHCESSLKKDNVEQHNIIDFFKDKFKSNSIVDRDEFGDIKTVDDYYCFVTMEDTHESGGYSILPHKITRTVTCKPKYVVSELAALELTQSNKLTCPHCAMKIKLDMLQKTDPYSESNNTHKSCIDIFIDEPDYDHDRHEIVTHIRDNENNREKMGELIEMNKCMFDTLSYTFDYPVIKKVLTTKFMVVKDQDTFNANAKLKIPFLDKINLTECHAMIAGGFCKSILLDQNINDIDIFFWGDDKINNFRKLLSQTLNSIKELHPNIKFLMMFKPQYNVYEVLCLSDPDNSIKNDCTIDNYDAHVTIDMKSNKIYRQSGYLNMLDPIGSYTYHKEHDKYFEDGNIQNVMVMYKLQFILANYEKSCDIFKSFDFHPAKVAYDGKTTYFTETSVHAYKYMINEINEYSYSATFNHRLNKYFDNGFSIGMPELDISKVSDESKLTIEVDSQMSLSFQIISVNNNDIFVEQNKIKCRSSHSRQNKTTSDLYTSDLYTSDLYTSNLYTSGSSDSGSQLKSTLMYIQKTDMNYLFTDHIVMPDEKGNMTFNKNISKIEFSNIIVKEKYDLYKNLRKSSTGK